MVTPKQLSELALSLPEAHERPAWGRPCFRVRDKIFASMNPEGTEVAIKNTEEERRALVAESPAVFGIPRHYENSTMFVAQLESVDPAELRELLTEAWRLTAPKRLRDSLD